MDTVAPGNIKDKPRRRPPAFFFALGRQRLPTEITVEGVTWRLRQPFKHDFFAATALYERVPATPNDPAGLPTLAVLKVQRTYPLCGLPVRWLGAYVARHEIAVYRALQGLQGIPRFLGAVGPTGFLHEYIPGCDLRKRPILTAEYFLRFQTLLSEMHQRHVAYVDSNKRENILLGDDGRPWLIDFQISFLVRRGERGNFLVRWIFRRFVRADWYHFYKHKTRFVRHACSPEDFTRARKRGFLHRLHRVVTRPLVILRRKILARYDMDEARWK